ncbi:MAG: hypothetical protein ACE5EY_08325, partial [Anaerolineae bacterium]
AADLLYHLLVLLNNQDIVGWLDNPQATVTVFTTAEDGTQKTFTLVIGRQDPSSNNTTVKWSEADYYVEVAAFNLEEMVQSAHADFLQEPTPVPAEAGTPAP